MFQQVLATICLILACVMYLTGQEWQFFAFLAVFNMAAAGVYK